MKIIIDIFRWVIALLILFIIIDLSFWGVLYAFEFIARKFDLLIGIVYFIIWMFLLTTIVAIINILVSLAFSLTSIIVRQSKAFLKVSAGLLFFGIWGVLILFWIGIMKFSWEEIHHSNLNKIFFSLFLLSMLYIPKVLFAQSLQEN